ncbi:hypothetical protein ACOXXX_13080 [Thalassococcus sp. BH17M4-6]|uniref:hypothetical protein n=1 Tax=Thalassococcus sp. BH17M4-6 TaxID=3413148 RepID=UPI003BED374A
MRRLAGIVFALVATPLQAQDVPLPEFAICMDREVARYERALRRHLDGPDPETFDIGGVDEVDYCGTVGIVRCDISDAPLPCQRDLRAEQDALAEKVRASLPAPEAVAGAHAEVSDGLYPQVWALAHGRSAGPDCTGSSEVLEVWCEAREANRRLQLAVLAWQVARFLDATPTAVAAGWASLPVPTRPRARPREG